jgi:hypothetical protein
MYLVLYCNKAYEHMLLSFLASRSYAGAEEHTVVFYSVGYDSDIDFPNLIKRRWDPVIVHENFQLYKPHIMLQSLEFGVDMLYFDTDILLGKRFDPSTFVNTNDYPLACIGPLEYVNYWIKDDEGNIIWYTERALMDYFSVSERTTFYLWTSMLSYGPACREFLQEWCSIVDNSYFHRDGMTRYYMPFGDETPFNVLIWKRGCTQQLPRHFINTISYEIIVSVETEDDLKFSQEIEYGVVTPDPAVYVKCDDSSIVQFYHGLKDPVDILKVVSWMVHRK